MSESMESALKEGSTAATSAECSAAREMTASVSTYTSIVARPGSTMPAPFAMPTTRAPPGSASERTLG